MNLFWREIASLRQSTLIWTASLAGMVILFMMMYPTFAGDAVVSTQIISNLPLAVRTALGISLSTFFSVFGFFAYLLSFAAVAGAIQAMNLGVGALSKEDSGKTVDFLLTKPISRAKVVTAKLAAAGSMLLLTNLIFSLVGLIGAKLASTTPFSSKTFLLISASLLLIQLIFLALGMVMSVLLPKVKSVVAVSLPTVFGFFIVGTLGSLLGNDTVKYVSPLKFFDFNYIMAHNGYEAKFLIIEAVLVLAAIAASYIIYIKKDIRAAS